MSARAGAAAIRAANRGLKLPGVRSSAMTLLTASILMGAAAAQTAPRSADDLIRFLTYQSDRPNAHGLVKSQSFDFSCGPLLGEKRDDRDLTNSLVAMGGLAIPALEAALDSFEVNGANDPVASKAGWLLLAYARIHGPKAFARQRRMIGNPILKNYALLLDESVALSLNLTSYVSSFRKPEEHQCQVGDTGIVTLNSEPCTPTSREIPILPIRCDRGSEPRDALDKLILALETGDRPLLELSLGPQAKISLLQLSRTIPAAIQVGSSGFSAVGYRFTMAGRWSEPEETMEEQRRPSIVAGDPDKFELDTVFYNRFGSKCESLRVAFTRIPLPGWRDQNGKPMVGPPTEYLIDNSNLADLLRIILRCATDPGEGDEWKVRFGFDH